MTFLRLAFGSDGEHRSWDAGLGETARLDRIVASDLIAVGWHGVLSAERARAMRQVIRDAVCPIIVVRVPVAPAAGPGAESPGGPR